MSKHNQWAVQALLSITFGVAAFMSTSAMALNLVVEPIYPPERSHLVHESLLTYLREETGLEIELVAPRSFHNYWSQLRERDDFDLVYDAPHITDFLVARREYTPLVKTTNSSSFTLVAGYSLEEATLDAVFGRTIVTMSAPSFGYMLLMQMFPNPLRQPNITSAAQSWEDAVQIVFDQDADAAMLPSWMAQRYPQLVPIQTTDEYPGKAISASPSVPESARTAIVEALTRLSETEKMADIAFELKVEGFETAEPAEFEGYMKLLENLYGYSPAAGD